MERILGVNLSGWFIPEPWVTPSLYAATGASNAAELQEAMGTVAYNERMRRHYETFVSEDDFRRMAQIGLNAVRLPVPWYAFGSQESDASYISVVDYIDRAIEWAAKYNIRVLLDLATVPGGQGDSNDSPTTPEAVAEWHSSTNGRHVGLDVLERLAFGRSLLRGREPAGHRAAGHAADERSQEPLYHDGWHSCSLPAQFLSRCLRARPFVYARG